MPALTPKAAAIGTLCDSFSISLQSMGSRADSHSAHLTQADVTQLCLGDGVLWAVLAAEGLVGLAAAPLLDAVVAFGFEAVEGLGVAGVSNLMVVMEETLLVPFSGVWAA